MNLVLLACSNRKQSGGIPNYMPSKQLEHALSTESFDRLMNARAELVRSTSKKIPIGPDAGIPSSQVVTQYLPAYQRYTGIVYEQGRVRELYPGQSNIRLVIISALYGLLDGDDSIQEYNLKMDDMMSGQRLCTWWKRQGLGKIVEEYIHYCSPAAIHDLLPINYRKALCPWPPPSLCDCMKEYIYPGQGQGSNYRRAEDLERLLLS